VLHAVAEDGLDLLELVSPKRDGGRNGMETSSERCGKSSRWRMLSSSSISCAAFRNCCCASRNIGEFHSPVRARVRSSA
jgi:hypothetical protein